MNKVILIGRLVRDPELRYTQAEEPMAIARYTLAVERRGKRSQDGNESNADFISCVAFGRLGEFAEKYLQKGLRVAVTGRIQTGSYTNQEGQKVHTTEIIVEEQEFADGKRDTSGSSQSSAGEGFMNESSEYGENTPFR